MEPSYTCTAKRHMGSDPRQKQPHEGSKTKSTPQQAWPESSLRGLWPRLSSSAAPRTTLATMRHSFSSSTSRHLRRRNCPAMASSPRMAWMSSSSPLASPSLEDEGEASTRATCNVGGCGGARASRTSMGHNTERSTEKPQHQTSQSDPSTTKSTTYQPCLNPIKPQLKARAEGTMPFSAGASSLSSR